MTVEIRCADLFVQIYCGAAVSAALGRRDACSSTVETACTTTVETESHESLAPNH